MSTDKVALITGTSSGIGLAAAVQAAKAGFRTVATVRTLDRADRLRAAAAEAGVELDIRALEVTDETAAIATVEGVVADYGRLDVLVNNAGAGHLSVFETETMADLRRTLEVNFFSVAQLSKAALPALRASGGRLITVTSVGGVVGQPFNEAYCAAKFAVEGLMEGLAPVAAAHGVKVTVIEPGAVASEFVNNLGVDPETLFAQAGAYAGTLQAYVKRTRETFTGAQTPDEVGEVVLHAMTTPEPPFRLQTSDWSKEFTGLKLADHDGSAVQRLTTSWVS
ncbi:MAG TPA: SDR family NAD(P)-dependent oxidoreductase [Amycolatopsis sp.]|nr:SDR family NAD(P)-dependent oxidoreductase [Amycolatopsis sp.]